MGSRGPRFERTGRDHRVVGGLSRLFRDLYWSFATWPASQVPCDCDCWSALSIAVYCLRSAASLSVRRRSQFAFCTPRAAIVLFEPAIAEARTPPVPTKVLSTRLIRCVRPSDE